MSKANLGSYAESNQVLLFGFKIQWDVKIHSQSFGYRNFRGFELSIEMEKFKVIYFLNSFPSL